MADDTEWLAALRAHAGVTDRAAFERHAAACRTRGARVEHVADLALAWAAGRGDGAAVRELDAALGPEVELVARRIDRTPQFVDELRQAVRVRLLVVEHDHARIDDYSARGPLRAWIGVVALRVALNVKRAAKPATTHEVLDELVSTEADPQLLHLKTLYRAEFREALEAALATLPERQRAILRLAFVDGLKTVQLARLYDVHETTAARWITRASADVAEDARRRLIARLALSPSSLDSVARMVLSNLELSIARVLGG